MFVAFYDNIQKQEFRKHEDREFIIPLTAHLTYARQLISFQAIVQNFGKIDSIELVGIGTSGMIIKTQALSSDYITASDKGGGDWLLRCDGGVLENQIEPKLFYIAVSSGNQTRYSEVFCKVRETPGKGFLLLNTGGYVKLNSGGNIKLNEFEEGVIIDEPVKVEYSSPKSFLKYDLFGFNGIFYINSKINFERKVEENDSSEYDGRRHDFEKIVSSIYTIEFWASRQTCDLLDLLYFFEDIKITDKYGNVYKPEEPVSVLAERDEPTAFYKITIEFKINNKLNYSLLEIAAQIQEDVIVGEIITYPAAGKTVSEQLDFLNSTYPNFEFVECKGQQLPVSDHPLAANVFPQVNVGGIPYFTVADYVGVTLVGVGTHTDSNGDSISFSSNEQGVYSQGLVADNIPPHTHGISYDESSAKSGSLDVVDNLFNGTAGPIDRVTGENTTAELRHNNIQPTKGVYRIAVLDKV